MTEYTKSDSSEKMILISHVTEGISLYIMAQLSRQKFDVFIMN